MADMKMLNTRIQQRLDLHSEWERVNPTLLAGEIAIAKVENKVEGKVVAPPAYLVKVGDGTSDYKTLPFVSAIAADVYDWAKAENKPGYEAKEITGIDAYIASYVNEQMGISVDTDTQYTVTKVNDYQYKLMSKSKGDASFATEVAVIDIPKYDDTALAGRVKTNEDAIALLNDTTGKAGSVAKAISDAIAALKLDETYEKAGAAATEAGKVRSELETYKGTNDAAVKAAKDKADENAGKIGTIETKLETVAEGAQVNVIETVKVNGEPLTVTDKAVNIAVPTGALASKDQIAEGDVEATLMAKINASAEGNHSHVNKGVLDGITAEKVAEWDAKQVAGDYATKTEAQEYADGLNTAMNTRVEALEAIDHDHSNKTVLDGITAEKVTAWDGAQAAAEATAASALAGAKSELEGKINAVDGRLTTAEGEIDALQEQILGLSGAMHFRGVVEAVPADGAEGYVSGDVVVVESTHKEYVYNGTKWFELGDEGSHITKTEVAATYETKIDAAQKLTDAKAYTDEKNTAMNTRVEALEAIDHTHTFNETELNKIVDGDVAKWNAAQANAEATAAAALKTAKEALEGQISDVDDKFADYETKTDAAQKLNDAKAYTDEKDTAMDTRVQKLEAIDHNAYVAADEQVLADAKEFAQGLVEGVDLSGIATNASDITALKGRMDTAESNIAKKANDADLAAIAKSGNVNDLVQTTGEYLIFNCGNASGFDNN